MTNTLELNPQILQKNLEITQILKQVDRLTSINVDLKASQITMNTLSQCSDVELELSNDLRNLKLKLYKQNITIKNLLSKTDKNEQLFKRYKRELTDLKDNLNNALGNEK